MDRVSLLQSAEAHGYPAVGAPGGYIAVSAGLEGWRAFADNASPAERREAARLLHEKADRETREAEQREHDAYMAHVDAVARGEEQLTPAEQRRKDAHEAQARADAEAWARGRPERIERLLERIASSLEKRRAT
jgi:hypothetical protein